MNDSGEVGPGIAPAATVPPGNERGGVGPFACPVPAGNAHLDRRQQGRRIGVDVLEDGLTLDQYAHGLAADFHSRRRVDFAVQRHGASPDTLDLLTKLLDFSGFEGIRFVPILPLAEFIEYLVELVGIDDVQWIHGYG